MFDRIGTDCIGFDDFRANGLLLPSRECAAIRTGLPLHRGPHRSYNALVIERVGRIESDWSRVIGRNPRLAHEQASLRLSLLQKALRRRLLDPGLLDPAGQRYALSSKDPRRPPDFSELDAMADMLWGETEG